MAFSLTPCPTFSDTAGLLAAYRAPGAGGTSLGINHFRFWGGVTTNGTTATILGIVTMPSGWAGQFTIEIHSIGPGGYARYAGGGSTNGSAVTINTDLENLGYTQSIEVNASGNSIQVYVSGVTGDCSAWIDLFMGT